jgi:hypothetical protein
MQFEEVPSSVGEKRGHGNGKMDPRAVIRL